MAFKLLDSLITNTQRRILAVLSTLGDEPLTATEVIKYGEIPKTSFYKGIEPLIKCGIVIKITPEKKKPTHFQANCAAIPLFRIIKILASNPDHIQDCVGMLEDYLAAISELKPLFLQIEAIHSKVRLSGLDRLRLAKLKKQRDKRLDEIAKMFGGNNK